MSSSHVNPKSMTEIKVIPSKLSESRVHPSKFLSAEVLNSDPYGSWIEKQGWSTFMSLEKPVYPTRVTEFYQNLHYYKEAPHLLYSMVGGKKIEISKTSLSRILGVKNEGTDMDTDTIEAPGFDENWATPSFEVQEMNATWLPQDQRTAHYFVINILMPKMSSVLSVSHRERCVMWHLINEVPLNLPSLILSQMKSTGPKGTLPYGSLLTLIFLKAGVSIAPNAISLNGFSILLKHLSHLAHSQPAVPKQVAAELTDNPLVSLPTAKAAAELTRVTRAKTGVKTKKTAKDKVSDDDLENVPDDVIQEVQDELRTEMSENLTKEQLGGPSPQKKRTRSQQPEGKEQGIKTRKRLKKVSAVSISQPNEPETASDHVDISTEDPLEDKIDDDDHQHHTDEADSKDTDDVIEQEQVDKKGQNVSLTEEMANESLSLPVTGIPMSVSEGSSMPPQHPLDPSSNDQSSNPISPIITDSVLLSTQVTNSSQPTHSLSSVSAVLTSSSVLNLEFLQSRMNSEHSSQVFGSVGFQTTVTPPAGLSFPSTEAIKKIAQGVLPGNPVDLEAPSSHIAASDVLTHFAFANDVAYIRSQNHHILSLLSKQNLDVQLQQFAQIQLSSLDELVRLRNMSQTLPNLDNIAFASAQGLLPNFHSLGDDLSEVTDLIKQKDKGTLSRLDKLETIVLKLLKGQSAIESTIASHGAQINQAVDLLKSLSSSVHHIDDRLAKMDLFLQQEHQAEKEAMGKVLSHSTLLAGTQMGEKSEGENSQKKSDERSL